MFTMLSRISSKVTWTLFQLLDEQQLQTGFLKEIGHIEQLSHGSLEA